MKMNDGGVVQLGERLNGIQKVRGSSPLTSTRREGKREKVSIRE